MSFNHWLCGCTASLLLVTAACAANPPLPGDASPPAGISGDYVQVEAARPSIIAFPNSSADDLWAGLPATFEGLLIHGGVIDEEQRVYGNMDVKSQRIAGESVRSLFRCASEGAGPSLVTQYRIEFSIAAYPRPLRSGGAELIVQTQASGTSVDGARRPPVYCVSNGSLELKIRQQMEVVLDNMGR